MKIKQNLKKLFIISFILLLFACGLGSAIYIINFLGLTKTIILIGSFVFLKFSFSLMKHINIKL